MQVVSANDAPFLHGKAGVIESRDGSKTSVIGSLNETREGWSRTYSGSSDPVPSAVGRVAFQRGFGAMRTVTSSRPVEPRISGDVPFKSELFQPV